MLNQRNGRAVPKEIVRELVEQFDSLSKQLKLVQNSEKYNYLLDPQSLKTNQVIIILEAVIAEHKVKLLAAKQCYDDVSGYVHYVHVMDMKIKKEFRLANMAIRKALG